MDDLGKRTAKALVIFSMSLMGLVARAELRVRAKQVFDNYSITGLPDGEQNISVGILLAEASFQAQGFEFLSSMLLNTSSGSPTDDAIKDAQVASNIDTQGGEGGQAIRALVEKDMEQRGLPSWLDGSRQKF